MADRNSNDITIPCLPPLPASKAIKRREVITTGSSTHNPSNNMNPTFFGAMSTNTSTSITATSGEVVTTSVDVNKTIAESMVANSNDSMVVPIVDSKGSCTSSSNSVDVTIPSLPPSITLFKAKTMPTSNLSASTVESHSYNNNNDNIINNKENYKPKNSTSSPSTSLSKTQKQQQHINQNTVESSSISISSATQLTKRSLHSPLHLPSTSKNSSKTPNTIQRRLKRVLRSGDTIESFFCLENPPSSSSSTHFNNDNHDDQECARIKSLCRDIVNDIDNSANDIRKWKDVLLYAYWNVERWWCLRDDTKKDRHDNGSDDNIILAMGTNLIKLHKRATSRFGITIPTGDEQNVSIDHQSHQSSDYEYDLVTIWLQYAKVQYKFIPNSSLSSAIEKDIRSTFQLLQNKNLGQSLSEFYIALADFELHLGSTSKITKGVEGTNGQTHLTKARAVIEIGIDVGAKSVDLLHEYLLKLDTISHRDNEGDILTPNEADENNSGDSHNYEKCQVDGYKIEIENELASSTLINAQEKSVPSNHGEGENKLEATSGFCDSSSLVSTYLNRSKKRPAVTSLRSKIRRKNNNNGKTLTFRTMGGPPKRLTSIDDDNDDDDQDEDTENVDDNLNELLNKKPKIAFFDRKDEKITPEYRNFLEQWDPFKKFNTDNKEKITPYLQYQELKPFQSTMDVIQENTKENHSTLTGINNTSSTASRGSHHATSSHNSAEISSAHNTSGKKEDAFTGNNSNRQTQLDDTLVQGDVTTASSPSISISGVDLDFLPLIQEKKIVVVNSVKYLKLGIVGKGGSCKVYRCLTRDLCTVAIKKVNLKGMSRKAVEGYANEIDLLRRLRGNNSIVQLFDSEVDVKRKAIFLVMEAGEVDLNHVLKDQSARYNNGEKGMANMNFVRSIWQQMLSVVHCIHEENIIHGDLKPANFLFVKGVLKLIDFGIAKAIQHDVTTNIYRDSQVGTLNYMSPESIQDSGTCPHGQRMKCGRPSDVWSLGCILYQMCYGKTPFAHIHSMFPKLQAIINPSYEIEFPDTISLTAIDAMKVCLKRKPKDRAPIVGKNGLLNEHRFLNSD